MKRRIFFNFLIVLSYLLLIAILKFQFSSILSILIFISGGALSGFILQTDYFIYVFVTAVNDPVAENIKTLFKNKKYKEGLREITRNEKMFASLPFHSGMFLAIVFILSVFVITSSGNNFGIGLVLGLFLNYILYLIYLFTSDINFLKKRILWGIVGEINEQGITIFLGATVLLFLGASIMFLR